MARPRQFDEEKTLAAVRDEFASKGFEATSLDDLMRVTGLGKGSIYAAFGDKHQLFLSALRLYSDATLKGVHAALSSDMRAIEKLRMLFRVADNGAAPAKPYRGCFLANSTTELAAHNCDVRNLARETYRAVEQLLAEVARQAQQDGDLGRAIEPSEFGRLLLAVMQGMEFLRKSGMSIRELNGIGHSAERLLLEGGSVSPAPRPSAARRADSLPTKPKRKKLAQKPVSAAKAARAPER
jgi:TetR/AcrR family transcriptional regulator, transcriptional repressor for nem operon